MSNRKLKNQPFQSLTLELSFQINANGDGLKHSAPTTSTCREGRALYAAGEAVAGYVADLIAIENNGGKKSLRRLFLQAPSRIVGDNVLIIEIQLSEYRPTRTKAPLVVERTLDWLQTHTSAEALSQLQEGEPGKKALLGINLALHEFGAGLRVRFMDRIIELTNLGEADNTLPGQPWFDEALVVVVGCNYSTRTINTKDNKKLPMNLVLRLDPDTYEQLRCLGPVYLRIWGRGFSLKESIKLLDVFWYEVVDFEEFHMSELTYSKRSL